VLFEVAAITVEVAEATLEALAPPTSATAVEDCVPVTSPVKEPLKLVAVPAVVAVPAEVALVAVKAFPFKLAVIVPALKLPETSLNTIVEAVFKFVAVVAELDTFPLVVIVFNLESEMEAVPLISAFTIKEVERFPETSL
jgi:hypothetical protein